MWGDVGRRGEMWGDVGGRVTSQWSMSLRCASTTFTHHLSSIWGQMALARFWSRHAFALRAGVLSTCEAGTATCGGVSRGK